MTGRGFRFWGVFVLLALLVVGGLLLRPRNSQPAVMLPSLELKSMTDQPVRLSDLKGKPVVLNAWATWCAPCRREMPLLLEAAEANPNLQFVFLNIGEGPVAVQTFEAEIERKIPNVYLDIQSATTDPLGIQGLPVTLFFDASGRLVTRHIGEIEREELEELLGRM
ncbi:MAG: TlpA disulfide reductase family protein [Meiothermus sp.]|nr:TlpA disulfide reductase family protein [Meiothermus sp.]